MPTSILVVAVLLNGSPIDFGRVPDRLKPHLKDGRVVVPVRQILESIGAETDFDFGPYKTTVTYINRKTVLEEEYANFVQQMEYLNWPAKDLIYPLKAEYSYKKYPYTASTAYGEVAPESPKIYRRMMPLGFLANTLKFSLKWDGKKKVVEITTAKQAE